MPIKKKSQKKPAPKKATIRSIKPIAGTAATLAGTVVSTLASHFLAKVLSSNVKKPTPGRKVNSFSSLAGNRPVFTGRKLVLLNPEATSTQIEHQAGTMSLKMANIRDFSGGDNNAVISNALQQADGIVFDKLKIAVVSNAGNERLSQLASVRNSHFLAVEPERYVYAIQAKIKRVGRAKAQANPLADSAVATWGIQATNILNTAYNGKGIKIAILDTGFDLNHPDFKNRVAGSKSFIKNEAVMDGNGHGSHCTGISAGNKKHTGNLRYGVASEAEIYIGKVLSNKGAGEDSGILAGIEWALENKCNVISMSLGSAVQPNETYYQSYESAAKTALENKCVIIAAAGNESDRTHGFVAPVGHPANCPSIMAVAAVDQNLDVAYFSCGGVNAQGGQVDIAGPGVDIYSSWKNGKYKTESGTSMATPFVAGVAALLWQANPRASASDIWMKLVQTAQRLSLPASDVGSGLVYIR